MTLNDPFRELAEAYALDALDTQERIDFEAHLAAGCKDCARALEEARWTISQLAYWSPDATPSPALKDQLLHAAGADAQKFPVVIPRKKIVPAWMWLGVAALLLVTAYTSWYARKTDQEMKKLSAQIDAQTEQRRALQQQLELAKHEALILVDPQSQKIAMPPTAPNSQMPQLAATWSPGMGLCIDGQNVPMPTGDHVLQLWLIPKGTGGKPMPSVTVRPDANGKFSVMVESPPDLLANTKALAITEEPAGGSPQPTSTPMWVGNVS